MAELGGLSSKIHGKLPEEAASVNHHCPQHSKVFDEVRKTTSVNFFDIFEIRFVNYRNTRARFPLPWQWMISILYSAYKKQPWKVNMNSGRLPVLTTITKSARTIMRL